jgi:hypothetical protein
MTTTTMTAGDIRDRLYTLWNGSEYVHIHEAPTGPDRSGRKLDVLVVSAWKSRGYEIDGVEIKVSTGDLVRELDNPAKAEWWWRHVNRFWVALPAELAARHATRVDWPATWGLLSVPSDQRSPVAKLRRPQRHDADPFNWPTIIGLLRAAADSGFNALQAAEARGREQGRQMAVAEAERASGDSVVRHHLTELRQAVAQFEEASGISITDRTYWAREMGEHVKLLRDIYADPDTIARRLGRARDDVADAIKRLDALTAAVATITNPAPAQVPA